MNPMVIEDDFKPDWASPPGDTMRDVLSERGLSEHDLALALGLKSIDDLLAGRVRITEELAVGLSKFLGT